MSAIPYETFVTAKRKSTLLRARRGQSVGSRSPVGRQSAVSDRLSTPKWGFRKYYLLSPQPESGRCRLQVILLESVSAEDPFLTVGILIGSWLDPLGS